MKLQDYLQHNDDEYIMVRYVHHLKNNKCEFETYTCIIDDVDVDLIETVIDEYGHYPLKDVKEFLDKEVKGYHAEECYFDGENRFSAVLYVLEK